MAVLDCNFIAQKFMVISVISSYGYNHWKWGKSAFYCKKKSSCPWREYESKKPKNNAKSAQNEFMDEMEKLGFNRLDIEHLVRKGLQTMDR